MNRFLSFSRPLFHRLRTLTALALGLTLLPLAAGCQQWSNHNLEELAAQSLSSQESAQLEADLAGVQQDDRTPAGLKQAAAILAQANPQAPTSAASRATQAAVIGRLFASTTAEPSAAWLTPEATPELLADLHEVFNQADQRLRSSDPDLITVMVWGQTGTTLRRADEIHAVLERAKTDDRLKELLYRDDPTRQSLYNFAVSYQSDWWREVSGVVWRPRVPSPMEQFGGAVGCVLLAPLFIVLVIHSAFGGTVDL